MDQDQADAAPKTDARPPRLDEIDRDAAPPAPWRWIVGIALLLGTLWTVFLLRGEVDQAVRQLYSDRPETRQAATTTLKEHGDREEVNATLLATLEQPKEAYSVRFTCARLLVDFEQLPALEPLLQHEELAVRLPVLDVLSRQSYFQKTYVEPGTFGLRDTLRAWLAGEDLPARQEAMRIVRVIGIEDELPQIRAMLVRSDRANVHPMAERQTLQGALKAVSIAKDCESIPAITALLEGDRDPMVRGSALDALYNLVMELGACDDVAPDHVAATVGALLDDEHAQVRQKALLLLAKQPVWAASHRDRMREILVQGESMGERRAALDGLSAAKGDAFERDLPGWFHHDDQFMRSSAVRGAGAYDPKVSQFTGCLIGIVRNEKENLVAYTTAMDQLRLGAGGYHLVQTSIPELAKIDRVLFIRAVREFFEKGASHGVDRHRFAKGWFAWYAAREGLDPQLASAATTAWASFWEKADAGNVAGARAAIGSLQERMEPLFLYERAWLKKQQNASGS